MIRCNRYYKKNAESLPASVATLLQGYNFSPEFSGMQYLLLKIIEIFAGKVSFLDKLLAFIRDSPTRDKIVVVSNYTEVIHNIIIYIDHNLISRHWEYWQDCVNKEDMAIFN
jgi:hypothetical protein